MEGSTERALDQESGDKGLGSSALPLSYAAVWEPLGLPLRLLISVMRRAPTMINLIPQWLNQVMNVFLHKKFSWLLTSTSEIMFPFIICFHYFIIVSFIYFIIVSFIYFIHIISLLTIISLLSRINTEKNKSQCFRCPELIPLFSPLD